MNLVELHRALRQLRLSGMATSLEPRLLEAQTDHLDPSISSPSSSVTSSCAARTGSSSAAARRPASATAARPSTPSTSTSTRR